MTSPARLALISAYPDAVGRIIQLTGDTLTAIKAAELFVELARGA